MGTETILYHESIDDIIRACDVISIDYGFKAWEPIHTKDRQRWLEFGPYIACIDSHIGGKSNEFFRSFLSKPALD